MKKKPNKNPFPLYTGEKDLTVSTLEKLRGRRTVSKQFILDFIRNRHIKQVERDIILRSLEAYADGTQIPVKKFASGVKKELIPLKTMHGLNFHERYTLSPVKRGTVTRYGEVVYQSPVRTSVGRIHFSGAHPVPGRYFAHTRQEDLPDNTRRIIEIQSDLFQLHQINYEIGIEREKLEKKMLKELPELAHKESYELTTEDKKRIEAFVNDKLESRKKELERLTPFRNTWQERIIREEFRRAAENGKTHLFFPTGKTALKIEGLEREFTNRFYLGNSSELIELEELKEGVMVRLNYQRYIVTSVLEGGKFKAIPKAAHELLERGLPCPTPEQLPVKQEIIRNFESDFDLSVDADKEHPIYKFYQKDIGEYLKKSHQAIEMTDKKGISWWQAEVKPEIANKPVYAFGQPVENDKGKGAGIPKAYREQTELDAIQSIREGAYDRDKEDRIINVE